MMKSDTTLIADKSAAVDRSALGRLQGALTDVPPSVWILIALLVFCVFASPVLLKMPFQLVIFRQAAPLGLAVCAQVLAMRCRSIDLSIVGVFILVNFIACSPAVAALDPWLAVLIPLLAGALIGLINGFFITVVRASAVIVTLATGAILVGIVLFLNSGFPPGSVPEVIKYLGQGRVASVPIAGLIWIATLVVLTLPLHFLVFGRLLKAVGDSPNAGMLSGLPVRRVILFCHIASGLLAALGGLLLTGYIGVSSTRIGADVVMNSIAGVILGGITFGSPKGGLFGPAIAAFSLALLFNILNVFGAGESGKFIVQGLVIAGAALLGGIGTNNR